MSLCLFPIPECVAGKAGESFLCNHQGLHLLAQVY